MEAVVTRARFAAGRSFFSQGRWPLQRGSDPCARDIAGSFALGRHGEWQGKQGGAGGDVEPLTVQQLLEGLSRFCGWLGIPRHGNQGPSIVKEYILPCLGVEASCAVYCGMANFCDYGRRTLFFRDSRGSLCEIGPCGSLNGIDSRERMYESELLFQK